MIVLGGLGLNYPAPPSGIAWYRTLVLCRVSTQGPYRRRPRSARRISSMAKKLAPQTASQKLADAVKTGVQPASFPRRRLTVQTAKHESRAARHKRKSSPGKLCSPNEERTQAAGQESAGPSEAARWPRPRRNRPACRGRSCRESETRATVRPAAKPPGYRRSQKILPNQGISTFCRECVAPA